MQNGVRVTGGDATRDCRIQMRKGDGSPQCYLVPYGKSSQQGLILAFPSQNETKKCCKNGHKYLHAVTISNPMVVASRALRVPPHAIRH